MNNTGASDAKLSLRVLAVYLCAALCLFTKFSLSGAPPDARKIMEGVYQQDTSHDTMLRASLEQEEAIHLSADRLTGRQQDIGGVH
jgi:hypothetical protein